MIDSHCHLDHEPLFKDIENVIIRSKNVGIKKILTICTTLKSFENIIKLIEHDDIIFGTFGIHPHETETNNITSEKIQIEVNKYQKIIGIGETGLDFYYDHSDRKAQIKSFQEHITAARNLKIPLIIHSRSAEDEMFQILKEYKNENLKILMHCFTGSKSFANKLMDFNVFFSASGIITFKKSIELQNTFKFIPMEKLLIETDSPYLAPEPNRGKKNEPSFIKYTAEKLANIKNLEINEVITKTSLNFNTLFN